MKTYIWKYSASVHGGKGKIKGRVEAPTFSEAETAVKENNLMVDAVSNLKLDRSPNARLHSFEKWGRLHDLLLLINDPSAVNSAQRSGKDVSGYQSVWD